MPQLHPKCPECGEAVVAAQAPADRVFCPRCRKIVGKAAPPSATGVLPVRNLAPPPPASPNEAPELSSTETRGQRRTAVLLLSAVGVMMIAGVVVAVILFRPDDPKPEPQPQNPVGVVPPRKPLPPHPRQKEIDEAIQRGVAHLKKRLKEPNGTAGADATGRFADSVPVGRSALVGLALLEAKVPASDPAIQKALADVRAGGRHVTMIYALGAVLFFLNRLQDTDANLLSKEDKELHRTLTLRMVAGQLAHDGRWSYQNRPISPEVENELLGKLTANTYQPTGVLREQPSHSMTQFALLALWGSRRHDLPVRPALLAAAVKFHTTQYPDGTWDYGIGKILHDSNTCAGLMALAMERVLREDQGQQAKNPGDPPANPKANEQRDKAFSYLAGVIRTKGRFEIAETSLASLRQEGVAETVIKKLSTLKNTQFRTQGDFVKGLASGLDADELRRYQTRVLIHSRKKQPGLLTNYTGDIIRADAWGDCYFLWCLERVAMIYDKKTIDGEDWYSWGVDILLGCQKQDGSWVDRHGDIADTCFALLFLTRANLAKDLTNKLQELMAAASVRNPSPVPQRKE